MGKGRLEAFSDGVLAIIITIMVLEMKVPHGDSWESLKPLLPVFVSYLLSFVYVGIYWNNHHHMLHAVKQVSGNELWANAHLLFWLSLVPFVIGELGLKEKLQPFSRCLICNGTLAAVDKETVSALLEENTRNHFQEFRQCNACRRVYWKGSHFERMEKLIKELEEPFR